MDTYSCFKFRELAKEIAREAAYQLYGVDHPVLNNRAEFWKQSWVLWF